MGTKSEVTELVDAASAGDDKALEELLPRLYRELHGLAHRERTRHPAGNRTLCTTALVHEAFLRLASQQELAFRSRAHFLGYCAQVMRSVVIDQARRSMSAKHGGGMTRVQWNDESFGVTFGPDEVLSLEQALNRLQKIDQRLARLTELRVFGGLKFDECAAVLDVSPRTVHRDWRRARAMLGAMLDEETDS